MCSTKIASALLCTYLCRVFQILSIIELIAAMVFESEEVTIMTTDFENPSHKLLDVNYIGEILVYI